MIGVLGKELRHDHGQPILDANGSHVFPGNVVKEGPSANFGDNYDPYWRAVVLDRIPHRDDGAISLVAYRLDARDTRSGGYQCWQWSHNLQCVDELAPDSVMQTYRSLVGPENEEPVAAKVETPLKVLTVEYRRLVSRDFNNETVGAVAEVPTGEDPKEVLHRLTAWVDARLGEDPNPPQEEIDTLAEKVAGIISRRLTAPDLPF